MNVTDMQREVLETGQVNQSRYADRIIVWLNEAQRYIVRQLNYRVGQTIADIPTTNDIQEYDMPSDYLSMIDFYNSDTPYSLRSMTIQQFDQAQIIKGQPNQFVVYGDKISLYPIPDGIYNLKLRYWKSPNLLDDGNDTPDIPEDYHHLLISYALSRCYRSEEDYDAMGIHWQEFIRDLGRMKAELNDDASRGPKQVSGTWNYPEYQNRNRGSFY